MSTRRPNVPRAGQNRRTSENTPRRNANSTPNTLRDGGGASTKGPGNDAEVLRPDFGAPERSARSATERSRSAVDRSPGGGAGPSSGGTADRSASAVAGPSTGSAKKKVTARSAAGVLRAKAGPVTAAARRVQERESVRYSIRQPVIGWTKGDSGPADGADGGAGNPRRGAGSLTQGDTGSALDRTGSVRDGGKVGSGSAGRSESGRGPGSAGNGPGSPGGPAGPADGAGLSPVPAKSFSGRLLALAVVLMTITVLLAPSVRTYALQREELAALSAQIQEQEATRAELKNELVRWEDPAYIKQQARKRLFLVMPGETRYLVVGAEETAEPLDNPGSDAGAAGVPWVDALWQSVQRSATE